MKVKLLLDGRDGKAGETAEVSPERSAFLLSIGAAEMITEAGEQAEEKKQAKPAARKTAAKKK